MADQGLVDSSPAPADNSPAPALADNSSAPAPAPAEEESEEEEGDQEGEDCVGSQEKQLKGAGKRKYAPVECAASVLAAIAASELGYASGRRSAQYASGRRPAVRSAAAGYDRSAADY